MVGLLILAVVLTDKQVDFVNSRVILVAMKRDSYFNLVVVKLVQIKYSFFYSY